MNKLAFILMSSRPWSFFLTLASVTTGSAVAYAAGTFHVGRFIVVMIGGVVTHAGINLLNDYFDFKHGVDHANVATSQYRFHPLVEGTMRPGQILAGAAVCYAIGDCCCGIHGRRGRLAACGHNGRRGADQLLLHRRTGELQKARARRALDVHRHGSAHGERSLLPADRLVGQHRRRGDDLDSGGDVVVAHPFGQQPQGYRHGP